MWLKLNMVEVDGKPGDKTDKTVLTLSQFQATLRQYGIDHFKNPILYFQLLLLSLQFEHAIKFLDSNPQLSVEMMHFAVALYYYGLLRLPAVPTHQLFVDDDGGQPRLNFIRLLKSYVRAFQQSDPDVALHYLCLIQDESSRNVAIKELILETEEFNVLVGQIEIDGNRKPGFLDRFLRQDKWAEIVRLAAQSCEENGRYDDAIKLYDIAGMFGRVLLLLSKQIGRVLTTQGPERTKIVEMAQFVRAKYARAQADPSKHAQFSRDVTEESREAFSMLLCLVSFFEAYWAGNAYKAVAEIEQLSFVPSDKRDVDRCAVQFKTLSESVRRNFSEILLTLMDCYVRLSQQRFDESNVCLISQITCRSDGFLLFFFSFRWLNPLSQRPRRSWSSPAASLSEWHLNGTQNLFEWKYLSQTVKL
jgi:nuclear pore complex protein Nup93